MREVYIFDIDGCVMTPIFSNFEKDEAREKIVGEAVYNGNGIKLFPDFVNYYRKYCVQAELIYFITGRKKSEFGSLTNKQLHPLVDIKRFNVIYYPETKSHKKRKYFAWKAKIIKDIIKDTYNKEQFGISNKENYIFNIFDDLNNYFPKIRKFGEKQNIQIHLALIENENNWNQILQ